MAKNNWTREQTIVAFNVYCRIPFKNSSARHPEIIKYANIIGRTPSALNMKVGNFGRLDPELKKRGITGLKNGAKLEKIIWKEFHGNWEALSYESESLIAQFQNKSLEEITQIDLSDIKEGVDKERIVKTRVNQNFFRSTILASYYQKCCITGFTIPDFLVASHIIPWSKNKKERLNPRNGLCLNTLHDRAFDQGYITITPTYEVIISKYLTEYETDNGLVDFFLKYRNRKIFLPDKFTPNLMFLEYHYEEIFKK